MKQSILPFSILLIAMCFTFQVSAQVTITANNFQRLSSFTDSVQYTNQTGIAVPSEGANQVWDYSSLDAGEFRTTENFDASNDTNFPNALNYSEASLEFQVFQTPINIYEAIDSEGWYDDGITVTDRKFSITAISGGPNDTLRLVGGKVDFEGRINLVKFPMTYQDQWSATEIRYSHFELSIAAFGLNQTPGFQKRYFSNDREVVGHGMLTIPKSDGTPSEAMDVLLLKIEQTTVDSFFLGGAPAPQALIDAFGLIQGGIATKTFYIFYKPDFAAPVLDLEFLGNSVDAFYRPQATDVVSSIKTLNIPMANSFPNPVSAGETIHVTIENGIETGFISFCDINGRLVYETSIQSVDGYNVHLIIPENMIQGLYMYRINNREKEPIALGKLMIK